MLAWFSWLLKRAALVALIALVTFLGMRAWDSWRALPLEIWHTHVPDDVTAEEIAQLDWAGYLAAEQAVFDEVRTEVTQKLEPEERVPVNRYFEGSPIYPGHFADDIQTVPVEGRSGSSFGWLPIRRPSASISSMQDGRRLPSP